MAWFFCLQVLCLLCLWERCIDINIQPLTGFPQMSIVSSANPEGTNTAWKALLARRTDPECDCTAVTEVFAEAKVSKPRKYEMVLNIISGTIFIFLTGPGIVGNISIFVTYAYVFFEGPGKKPVRLILIHLAFTNIMILLSKGMSKTVTSFGLTDFLDDIGCKIVVYVERVARGVSICTSSLLTVVQAITIRPHTSQWMWFKPKSPSHVLPFFLFFWIFNSLISMNLLYYITHISSMNISQVSEYDYCCYFQQESQILSWVSVILMVLRDGLFQGLMGWASGSMVFLLHQHHRRVLYLQTCTSFLYKTPPEVKATQSVLLLMLCFLFFYWTDCFISLYLNYSSWKNPVILHVREFTTFGYSILSPFVLIHRDVHVAKYWLAQ